MQLNWLDVVIAIVFAIYAFEGFEVGFIEGFLDFTNFIISFILGLLFFSKVGIIFTSVLGLPIGFANALGFFTVSFLSEFIFAFLLNKPIVKFYHFFIPSDEKSDTSNFYLALIHSINRFFGLIPGIASAWILLSFLLTTIIALPFSPFLKQSVSNSRLGNSLVVNTQSLKESLNKVFGGAINESLTFLTVKPESNESVILGFTVQNPTPDMEAEKGMFNTINKERTSRGLAPLVYDNKLKELAEIYAKAMFNRGYFSHYTPEGVSPFDRMANANIVYQFAGENLALAPNTDLAMQGLMESKGHRDNILSGNFGRVGIGVLDGGIYGKMFVQEFTD